MIDKALMIIIFMYATSLMLIGLDYTLLQPLDIDLISPLTGEDIIPDIELMLGESEFNERTTAIASANYTGNSTFYDRIETFTTGAAFVAWELIQLMTGTLIFNVMLLFGVPQWLVTLFITVYILLLARAIIGYVRGI